MLVFALDTATLQGSYGYVKLDHDGADASVSSHAMFTAPASPGHAETAIDRMAAVLSSGGFTFKDIDLLVFGRGPGTFTGVRIGLSTIKGVALACNASVIGLSSLEALAFSAGRVGWVASLIDAKRKELFGALYDVSVDSRGWPVARAIMAERVANADDIIRSLNDTVGSQPLLLTGNGVAPYRDPLLEGLTASVLPDVAWTPSPFWMARIGHQRFVEFGPDDLDTVEPVYLREPDARLPVTPR